MDVYQKITNSLEPLGGEMLLDAFAEARRATLARSQAVAAIPANAPAASAAVPPAPSDSGRAVATSAVPSANDQPAPPALDDTGKLRLEIQEFLRERSGFDPTQIE